MNVFGFSDQQLEVLYQRLGGLMAQPPRQCFRCGQPVLKGYHCQCEVNREVERIKNEVPTQRLKSSCDEL